MLLSGSSASSAWRREAEGGRGEAEGGGGRQREAEGGGGRQREAEEFRVRTPC